MDNSAKSQANTTSARKRTAVLAVHGIGNQRALETVRGVAAAVTLGQTGFWLHPERSGIDVDLSVLTAKVDDRRDVDFHELYWAHLMSETRAIAVILWLFELVSKGPLLRRGMNAVWWGSATFVCAAVASVTLICIHIIQRFAQAVDEPAALILAPMLIICAAAAYAGLASLLQRAWIIATITLLAALLFGGALYYGLNSDDLGHLTALFLPALASLFVIWVIMGGWGVLVFTITYLVTNIALMVVLNVRYQIYWDRDNIIADIISHRWIPFLTPEWQPFWKVWHEGWIVWSLTEHWSLIIACSILIVYLALNGLFLQSYLGDAARYFRNSPGNVGVRREIRKQAVATLAALHESGLYDRIVIVAHSLGSVIAYDMMRAYFSRVCDDFPAPDRLGAIVERIDRFELDGATKNDPEALARKREEFRILSRALTAEMAQCRSDPSKPGMKRWLVTDFITLGSPLTHAQYLMCLGNSLEELAKDFSRRVDEREFPTCPPELNRSSPNRLLFNPGDGVRFHHGGLFGFTRWTNLYFPMHELFWGDPIGGTVSDLFGPFVLDTKVSVRERKRAKDVLFSHTYYWDGTWPGGFSAPHIKALEAAVDLKEATRTNRPYGI
ncbi:hypothetical protein [Bradyrhizobium sp. BWA-3-5]|uniref:hypothetical protein n=1 Tax=Bradyrhizobium sp. BWA-3-5 TaxID=3080013 RepID=UPI00293F4A54|nr:hypothetical protein [Bradyrhizobium sp. BWA-3-5]WOH63613.1 hypothetical protein RX331_23130 [Bradyrhizobium sp. BWA-3-5]